MKKTHEVHEQLERVILIFMIDGKPVGAATFPDICDIEDPNYHGYDPLILALEAGQAWDAIP